MSGPCIAGPARFHAACCEVGTWGGTWGLFGERAPSRCEGSGRCVRPERRQPRRSLPRARHGCLLVRYVCLQMRKVRAVEAFGPAGVIAALEDDLAFLQRGGTPAPGMSREANIQKVIGELLRLRAAG